MKQATLNLYLSMTSRAASLLSESKRSGDERQRAEAFAIVKAANRIFMEAQK
jgi:hypothetical protein